MKTLAPTVLSLAFFAVLANGLPAHEDHAHPKAIEPAEQHKPSLLPDRIILTWTEDPAHTQNITWRTDASVSHGYVEFAVADHGPYFVQGALRINATTNEFNSDLGKYHLHSARLAALAPNTKYVYRVGDGTNWSEWFQLKTASDRAEPFSFIYFGDAQNDLRSMWSRVIREAHADAPRASFMLHAGDLVNRGNRDAEWGEWFGAGAWLNGMMPSIATPGNHEYEDTPDPNDDPEKEELSRHWRPQFAFPTNGPKGLEETVYWLDYQGVRFISLNSNERQQEQVEWLDEVLAANPHRWAIVTFHHPIFSAARGRDNADLRARWKPIFDNHEVDLVLQGHDHAYARTGLDVPENLAEGVNVVSGGTVYVVSVSGPKMYSVDRRDFMLRSASGVQLYQIISIDGDNLTYEARTATGELYDAFELTKQDGRPNRLVNRIPDTPEIRSR